MGYTEAIKRNAPERCVTVLKRNVQVLALRSVPTTAKNCTLANCKKLHHGYNCAALAVTRELFQR
jgi:hypothetical protein